MNPFELADYLGAGVALLAGLFAGRRMRPEPPEPLRPTCSCDHGFGTHKEGGKCKAEVLTVYNEDRYKKLLPCPCMRYDGPDPAIFGLNMGETA